MELYRKFTKLILDKANGFSRRTRAWITLGADLCKRPVGLTGSSTEIGSVFRSQLEVNLAPMHIILDDDFYTLALAAGGVLPARQGTRTTPRSRMARLLVQAGRFQQHHCLLHLADADLLYG